MAVDLGVALVTHLATIEGVRTLIGNRIFPDALPQGVTLPAVVYYVIDSVGEEDLQGPAGLAQSRVQLDAYAVERTVANSIVDKLRRKPPNGLVGHRGDMGGLFVHGISTAGGRRFDSSPPNEGSDVWRYVASQDFMVSHEEDI